MASPEPGASSRTSLTAWNARSGRPRRRASDRERRPPSVRGPRIDVSRCHHNHPSARTASPTVAKARTPLTARTVPGQAGLDRSRAAADADDSRTSPEPPPAASPVPRGRSQDRVAGFMDAQGLRSCADRRSRGILLMEQRFHLDPALSFHPRSGLRSTAWQREETGHS